MIETAVQVQVLIIVMDEAFRRNVSERLHLEGVDVFEASNEDEATDIALSNDIDVVLLGVKGFRHNGLQFLRFIKENRPLTEVILMTPLNDHSLFVSIEAMKLGAFDDLLIPFGIETLLSQIKAAGSQKKRNEKAKSERTWRR